MNPEELERMWKERTGPQRPGGVYVSYAAGEIYAVIAIERLGTGDVTFTVVDGDGEIREHSEPWSRRDRVVQQPTQDDYEHLGLDLIDRAVLWQAQNYGQGL